jgi:hypothetical protein
MHRMPDASTAVSTHYQGEAGAAYHHYYEKLAPAFGELNARKFQQFVAPTERLSTLGAERDSPSPGFRPVARLASR